MFTKPQDILRLRNEAIAALALVDIELTGEFPTATVQARPSPKFRYFAGGDAQSVLRVYDAKTGREIWRRPIDVAVSAALVVPVFSPDERFLVGCSDYAREQALFDAASGRKLLGFEMSTNADFAPVAFSSDSRQLAVCNWRDPIRVYDLENLAAEPVSIPVPFGMRNVFFYENNRALAAYDWDLNAENSSCTA